MPEEENGKVVGGNRRALIRADVAARFPRLAARRIARPRPLALIDSTAIALGRNQRGAAVMIGEAVRVQHMHIVGSSGGGKSNTIEHIVRQTIEDGRGVVLIDPHGHSPRSVYRHTLAWLRHTGRLEKRPVHIIDPNDPDFVTGIQPFARPTPSTDVSVVASNAYEAVEKVFGAGETAGKGVIVSPTIRRILMAEFAAAAEQGLTFAELPLLLQPYDEDGLRQLIVDRLRDRYAKSVLAELHQMALDDKTKRDYRAEVVGPLNRLSEFVRAPAIRNILGQSNREHVLDFGSVLANNEIVLMNAAGGERVSSGDAEVLARLVLRTLFFHIERRKQPFTPYFVAIDECHKVLTGDVERMLAEVRKQGVGFVLSHQTLSQLGKPDDSMRVAVSGNTNIKMAFRLRDSTEAKELAEAIIPLDLERPVATLVRPTVVGHRRTLFRSAGVGRNQSTSHSVGVTETDSVSETVTESFAETVGHSIADSETDTEGTSSARSTSTTEGRSVADSISETIGTSSSETRSHGSSRSDGSSTAIGMNVPAGTSAVSASMSVNSARRGWLGASAPTTRTEADNSSRTSSDAVSSTTGYSEATTTGRTTTRSRAKTVGETAGRSRSHAKGRTVGESFAVTKGVSIGVTVGKSVGTTVTDGETTGTSESQGVTEGLEPIYELLPTAVHGIENVRYMAAQILRGLPTGQAFLNLVTKAGMQAAHVFTPEICSRDLSEAEFAELRRSVLERSPSAVPIEQAEAHMLERERRLLAEAKTLTIREEPASFRVAAPKRLKKSTAKEKA